MKTIPYGKQFVDKKDGKNLLNSLSNDLITTGPIVKKFEKSIRKYLKCKFSYVCNSGTSAIHLAFLSAELKKGDVILMPSVNFIASYNMAKIMGLKVFLVDVDEFSGQITIDKVLDCINRNKLKKISALVLMYNGGYPIHSNLFFDLKKKYKFTIIEDACHAFGAEYKFKNSYFKIGSCKHADISTFSLHPLKTITTGEGGIITTNNKKISQNIKLFRSHGLIRNKKKYWEYDIKKYGFNYRLSDINCSLGLSQLNKINFFLKKREIIYKRYIREINNFNSNLIIPKYPKNIKPAYHLFLIHIRYDRLKKNKEHFIKYLLKNNICPQQHYIPIYKFSIFKDNFKKFLGAEKYFKNSLSIPIFVELNINDQKKIIKIIKHYFK